MKTEKCSESFLINTARDFDIDIETVIRIARQNDTYSEFYKKLEDFVAARIAE